MSRLISCFYRDDEAATAVEYAIMLAAIIIVCIAAIAAVGSNTQGLFSNADTEMQSHGIGP